MTSRLSSTINALNSVALGEIKADLILKNCSLVSLSSGEIVPKSDIAIYKDRIAYVGPNASHCAGPKTTQIDLNERYVSSGFVDPHVHIDQFVLPSELVKYSLLHGVTSLFSDPIDIVSVCGFQGFREFIKLGQDLPMRIFHVIPGGLPVDRKFSHKNSLTAQEQIKAIRIPDVVGLGEVFSWTKVTTKDKQTMNSIKTMLDNDCIINGHTAGASEKKLNSYIASGILSCHEPIDYDQVIERLRLGMWVMIREGSIRRDLTNIVAKIISNKTFTERLMFCSDGLDPHDLEKFGHIDHCVRESVRLGMNPITALTMASRNCFDYYGMSKDLGTISPGKLADILVFDNLKDFVPKKVFLGGKLVVSNGNLVTKIKRKKIPNWLKNTVKLPRFEPDYFSIRTKKSHVSANTIKMKTEIITELGSREVLTQDGFVLASKNDDLWKVAAIDRSHGTKKRIIGFLEGLGGTFDSFASTWSFHENDLIIIGSNDSDMAIAANHLVNNQGGMVVTKNGKIIASMQLSLAGIISTKSFEDNSKQFLNLNKSLLNNGCRFERPHLVPLFLPFLALPSVRILHSGIIDVKNRKAISPIT